MGVLRNHYILPLITKKKRSFCTLASLQSVIVITDSLCDTFVNPNRTNRPDHEDEDIGAPYTPWAPGALPQRGNDAEEWRYVRPPPGRIWTSTSRARQYNPAGSSHPGHGSLIHTAPSVGPESRASGLLRLGSRQRCRWHRRRSLPEQLATESSRG
jgi:hypothetical protein